MSGIGKLVKVAPAAVAAAKTPTAKTEQTKEQKKEAIKTGAAAAAAKAIKNIIENKDENITYVPKGSTKEEIIAGANSYAEKTLSVYDEAGNSDGTVDIKEYAAAKSEIAAESGETTQTGKNPFTNAYTIEALALDTNKDGIISTDEMTVYTLMQDAADSKDGKTIDGTITTKGADKVQTGIVDGLIGGADNSKPTKTTSYQFINNTKKYDEEAEEKLSDQIMSTSEVIAKNAATWGITLAKSETSVYNSPTLSQFLLPKEQSKAITNPNGTILDPNGTIYPNGTIIDVDGKYLLPEGCITNADGSYTLADGSVQNADGSVTYTDGRIQNIDGTIKNTDGSIKNTDGTTLNSDGTITLASGKMTLSKGATYDEKTGIYTATNGRKFYADGSEIKEDGTIKNTDGTSTLSDGVIKTKNGTYILKNGVELPPQTVYNKKDGTYTCYDYTYNADGKIINQNNTIKDQNGKSSADGPLIKESDNAEKNTYKIKSGDTLSAIICNKYGVKYGSSDYKKIEAAIVKENNLKNANTIYAGANLTLPDTF